MVAGLERPEANDPSGVRKLLRLIGSLRATPAGNAVYRQIEDMMDEIASHHLKAELAYAGFVDNVLEALASQLPSGSLESVQVKLLQARLEPPLSVQEVDRLGDFVNQYVERIQAADTLQDGVLLHAVKPLLAAFGIEEGAPAGNTPAQQPASTSRTQPLTPDPVIEPAQADEPVVDTFSSELADLSPEEDGPVEAGYEEPVLEQGAPEEDAEDFEAPAVEDYSELDIRRDDLEKLQSTLGQQVLETITQNEEFGVVLESVLADLEQNEDGEDAENLRSTLIHEIDKLMKGHNELADKLDSTHHYLQLFQSDSRQLTDELSRVRLLSLTDELTGLHNRRAFVRRMEDEVARVQRYGFPLSFTLIDLDHFKAVNDEFGHAAGDEVLRVYAKNILSIFRHHDMVARYGGEEFAVLLPNTDADGAIRALNKVKRRAAETRWQNNGALSDVPTFSAGVSLYKPGESASAFIERADKALYRAKRLGRNRIELDMTYQTENDGRTPRRRSTDF